MKKKHYLAPTIDFTEVRVERGFAESAHDLSFEDGYGDEFDDTYAAGNSGRMYY